LRLKSAARRFRLLRIFLGVLAAAVFIMGLSAGAASQWALESADLVAGIQLLPSLARMAAGGLAGITGLSLAWLLVLVFTLAFGRFYCSTLCPLGLFQDGAAWLGRVGRKLVFRGKARGKTGEGRRSGSVGANSAFRGFASPISGNLESGKGFPLSGRILLAAAGVLGAVFAPAVLAWLEPYALAARLGSALFGTAWEFAAESAIRSGYFLPAEPLRFDPAWMAAALVPGLLVLAAAVYRPRLFCRWLCPAGALLRLVAARPVFGFHIKGEVCTSCGACQRICRTGAADSAGRRIDSGSCVGCFDCMVVCPVGAVRYGRPGIAPATSKSIQDDAPANTTPANKCPTSPVFTRRNFMLAGGTGLAAAAFALPAAGLARRPVPGRLATTALVTLNGKARAWASPPGSLSVERFSRLCLSCGLCARACPSGVLRQGLAWWKAPSILEPYMDFARGFCQFECVACGEVCPSGAIKLLPVDAKTTAAVARSSLDLPKCIVIEKGTPCGACAEHCPTGALDMERVPAHRHPIPVLDETLCVGCGACETVCPSEPVKALIVSGLAVHETARVLPQRPGGGAQASGQAMEHTEGRPSGEDQESRPGGVKTEQLMEQVPDATLQGGEDGFPF
jgi:ferredoxin